MEVRIDRTVQQEGQELKNTDNKKSVCSKPRGWDGNGDGVIERIFELRPPGRSWVCPKDGGNFALVPRFC